MNIIEALAALKEGKKVRQPTWPSIRNTSMYLKMSGLRDVYVYYPDGGYGKSWSFSTYCIEAEWEIYVPKGEAE